MGSDVYLKINTANGKSYLYIVQSYREPKTKKTKKTIIKSLGCLEDLEKVYPDPISHFRAVVKNMNENAVTKKQTVMFCCDPNIELEQGCNNRKNVTTQVH